MDPTIAQLILSNSQWAAAVTAADHTLFKRFSQGQSPKILWIGCSDSRVPDNVVTASGLGHIFTHRNIANQVHLHDDNVLSVITYAVASLGVEHILIVGHTKCGGAEASLKAARGEPLPPGPLERWLTPLTELTRRLGLQLLPDPEALIKVIEASVREQVAHVAESEPVRAAWTARRNLWVHGFVYELENGKLRHLNVTRGPPA